MRKILPVLSGPHANEAEAIRHQMRIGHWIGRNQLRRWRLGWYVLDRTRNANHVGSKAWRRAVRWRPARWDKG